MGGGVYIYIKFPSVLYVLILLLSVEKEHELISYKLPFRIVAFEITHAHTHFYSNVYSGYNNII